MTPTTDINTSQVFTALETWIKQKPKLEPADYGLGHGQTPDRKQWFAAHRAYSTELRNIARQRREALDSLIEARSLHPAEPAILRDAFRAFSGRLEWNGKLEYTAGQYFPTEYRPAASAVLQNYIAAWRQKYAAEHPKEFTYACLDDVIVANKSIGNHWFERSTMRFFNTRLGYELYAGKYFWTSEKGPSGKRAYSVRIAQPDGTIDTLGEFQAHETKHQAVAAIRAELAK